MDPNKQAVMGGAGRKAVTIREIALEAGVSTATVSRVFNTPEVVSKQTRETVLAVIERNHYVAHGFAAGLASRRSRLLGLIIPTITNSIYASSTQAIQKAAQDAGYTVLMGVSEFSPALEAKLIHRLLERRVEGLIVTGAARAPEIYEKMTYNRVPFVITWKLTTEPNRPSVSFDNYKAASAAVEYLLSLGHRRLGLVCGRTELNDRAHDRRRAFEDSLRNAGITPDPQLIYERDFEFVEGRAAMRHMLVHDRRPTAVFCANDIQAVGALYECHAAGLRVPQDISIVGFDDLPVAQYIDPQLTTVRVPAAEMGQRAAETLISSLKTGDPLIPVELPTDLIIRGSTAPPSGR